VTTRLNAKLPERNFGCKVFSKEQTYSKKKLAKKKYLKSKAKKNIKKDESWKQI